MNREKKVVGIINIMIGSSLLLFAFVKDSFHSMDYFPIGFGLFIFIYGILILMDKVKIKSREPWQYQLMIGLFIAAMVLAFLNRPKSTYVSPKQKIETELQNK